MSGYVPNAPKNFRYDEAKPADIHARRWAEYEKYGKAPAAAKEKTSVALRIGVFFDGTLNNAGNAASGLLCGAHHPIRPEDVDASCKPYTDWRKSRARHDPTLYKRADRRRCTSTTSSCT